MLTSVSAYNTSMIAHAWDFHNNSDRGYNNSQLSGFLNTSTAKFGVVMSNATTGTSYTSNDATYWQTTRNATLGFWFYPDSTASVYAEVHGDSHIRIFAFTDGNMYFQTNGNTLATIPLTALKAKNWNHIILVQNQGTNASVYVNNTFINYGTAQNAIADTTAQWIGAADGGGSANLGMYYQWFVTREALNATDRACIFNTGIGIVDILNPTECGGTPTYSSVSFPTAPTPTTGSTINVNSFPINITVNATYANNNISLFNATGRVASTIIGAGNNQLVSFNVFYASSTQTFTFNGTNNETSVLSASSVITINTAPVFSTVTPLNNTQLAVTNITFTTLANNSIPFNASFYINGIINETKEIAAGSNVNVSFNKVLATGTSYTFSINGTTWDGRRNQTTTNLFYIDSNIPSIDATTFINNSVYYLQNISGQFNISDDFAIFSVNASIDGTQIDGVNGLSGTFYQYNLSHTSLGIGIGRHTLSVRVADGHTAAMIPDYEIDDGIFNNKVVLKYKNKELTIEPESFNIADRMTTEKIIDRYTFDYIPANKGKKTNSFIVSSENTLYIIDAPESKLKKWLVTDDKWVDFDVANSEEQLTITRIDFNKVKVDVTTPTILDELNFNSIGDLNIVQRNYTFYTINATLIYTNPVLESVSQSIYLNITHFGQTTATGELNYNGSIKASSSASTTNDTLFTSTFATPLTSYTEVPAFWNMSFIGINTFTALIHFNQTINQIEVSNCSGGTNITTMNFTTLIEGTTTRLITNTTGVFVAYASTRDTTIQFNLSWEGKSQQLVCMQNISDTFYVDYRMEAQSDGYYPFRTNAYNQSVNTSTISIKKFSGVSVASSPSTVVANVIDAVASPLVGYILEITRYNYANGQDEPIRSELTNSIGSTAFQYITNAQYGWNIYDRIGNVVYTAPSGLISSSPITLSVLTTQNQYVSKTLNVWQLRTILYNSSSNIFLNWTTLAGQGTICLNVTKVNASVTTFLSGQCSSASSGFLTYNVTENEGRISAIAYIRGSTYVTNLLSYILNPQVKLYQRMGIDALLVYILFIFIAVAVSLLRVSMMPFFLGIAHLASWWMGVIPGTYAIGAIGMMVALILVMLRVR